MLVDVVGEGHQWCSLNQNLEGFAGYGYFVKKIYPRGMALLVCPPHPFPAPLQIIGLEQTSPFTDKKMEFLHRKIKGLMNIIGP